MTYSLGTHYYLSIKIFENKNHQKPNYLVFQYETEDHAKWPGTSGTA